MQWKCMHVRLKSGGVALASSWRVNFSSTISVVVTGDNQRTNPIHSSKTYFYKSCLNSWATIPLVYLEKNHFHSFNHYCKQHYFLSCTLNVINIPRSTKDVHNTQFVDFFGQTFSLNRPAKSLMHFGKTCQTIWLKNF